MRTIASILLLLASSVYGYAQVPAHCAPNCLDLDDALVGIKALSVWVEVAQDDRDSEEIIKPRIEAVLRQNGIQILPKADPATFPVLRVVIHTLAGRERTEGLYAYMILLDLREIFPNQKGMKGQWQRVTTWDDQWLGMVGGLDLLSVRQGAVNMVSEDFIPAWKKANGH